MDSSRIVVGVVFTYLAATFVNGFETGGPLTLCNDPYPHHHGHYRSLEPTPYAITLSAQQYNPGDSVTVTVSSPSDNIHGFQIGAHSVDGLWEHLYGKFSTYPTGASLYKYYSDVVNCVTHGKDYKKSRQVQLTWIAPNVSVGDLVFSATVVKDFEKFWVNHTAVLLAATPAAVDAVVPSIAIGAGSFDPDLDLSRCGSKSGCVTYPANCMADTCHFAISYKSVPDGIRFRILNKRASISESYMAMGISADQSMKQDETFTCMDVGGSLEFAHGFNPALYNIKVRSDQVEQISMQSVDGVLSCEFTRAIKGEFSWYGAKDPVVQSVDYSTALSSPQYHLYLAWGRPYAGSKESAEKHGPLPIVSKSKVAFGKMNRHHFYTLHDNVKIHVTFMVVAWCGAAAIAMIISRYYKHGFANAKDMLCGLKPWFQVHRGLAFFTTLLTIIAFVLIFVQYMGLTEKQLLHAGFGITVMILTCMQVFAGMLRPDPNSGKKRIIFNWVHRLSGFLTYALAIATTFIGTNISYLNDSIKETGTGLVAGMVAVQLFTAIILELLSACGHKNEDGDDIGKSTGTFELEQDSNIAKNGAATTAHTKTLAVLVAYLTVLVALLICFLAVIWLD